MSSIESDEVSVSVVMPVYNGMPHISHAINSILEQLGESDELVIIDNYSKDGTSEWLKGLTGANVRVVFRNSTQAVELNWTEAVNESRGRYVKLICADDTIELGSLEEQRRLLEADDSLAMVASLRRVISESGIVVRSNHGLNGMSGVLDANQVIQKCALAGTNLLGEPAAVMFRGDVIRASMPWESRWPYLLDLATYIKVLNHGNLVCDPETRASFRISRTSWSADLLDSQSTQFKNWRDWHTSQGGFSFGWLKRVRANITLKIRTIVRRWYFLRRA